MERSSALSSHWTVVRLFPRRTGPHSRGPALFELGVGDDRWAVRQTVDDPEGWHEWKLLGRVDPEASRSEGRAVVVFEGVSRY